MKPAVAKKITPYLFILPFVLLFLTFMVYPILESFYLSFTAAEGSTSSWVGLDNFRLIFSVHPAASVRRSKD